MREIGDVVVARHADGTRTVVSTSPVIRVLTALLASIERDVVGPDGVLQLDTAGEYRYRFVGVEDQDTLLFERVTDVKSTR